MRRDVHLLAALLSLAAVSGCASTDQDGNSAVDLSSLNTGNYQSSPRDANTAKVDDSGRAIEAIRLGEATPLPVDIDPTYEFQAQTAQPVRVAPNIPTTLSAIDEAEFRAATPGLIAGWKTGGHRRISASAGRSAYIYTFAFETPAQAEAAKENFADKQQVSDRQQPISIPDLPYARATWDGTLLNSWLVRDAMLMGVRVIDPLDLSKDPTAAVTFATKAYTKLIQMLSGYAPTPKDERAQLPIDIDGLLSRTLPSDKDSWVAGVPEGAVEPVQASLARDNRPGRTRLSLNEAGVDLVASDGGTRIYRASDRAAAETLMGALIAPDADYRKPIESPANLPSAQCFEAKDSKVPAYTDRPICYVAFDRYLARVSAFTVPDLHQRTAAQYKMLASGR